jgi:hypothetical protein
MPDQNKISSYEKLLTHYAENKDKPWKKWLEFNTTFAKPGKQGLVGLLKSREGQLDYVFKLSQYINYLVQHENEIMRGLNTLSDYCPHFCKGIGVIECEVNPRCRRIGNPFEISKMKITKEVMLCEHIQNSTKFYNYIRAVEKVPEDVLYSTIKQVLLATAIAQKKQKFVHYDLHSNNIMMKKCSKDVVFLYVLDEENQFCVPTLGNYPIIIDFGFSYIKGLDDGPLWPSMGHTDVGFMSNQFDSFADPKLFLVTVSGELKEKRKSKKAKRLRRVVRNMFNGLKIDWLNGWDKGKTSASDCVNELISSYNQSSELFKEYEHHCIDIIQSLIILPLQEQDYSQVHISYTAFLKEWIKIEKQISSSFYNLYILKGIIDAARKVNAAYRDKKSRKTSVIDFHRMVDDRINSVVKFCQTKKINFEVLLCSLLVLARNIEGILYDIVYTQTQEKELRYDKLPLQSIEQIYAAIETNIQDDYIYNGDSSIIVLDSHNEVCDSLSLSEEETKIVNELHPIARGTYIYDLYKSKGHDGESHKSDR